MSGPDVPTLLIFAQALTALVPLRCQLRGPCCHEVDAYLSNGLALLAVHCSTKSTATP